MSSKSTPTTRKWNTYVDEAKAEDFVLEMDGDAPDIHITNPTGVRMMRVASAVRAGDEEALLLALCGDAYTEGVQPLLVTAGHKVVGALVEDLMDHFDLYEPLLLIGPSGDRVTEKRPTQIKALQRIGYKIQGE